MTAARRAVLAVWLVLALAALACASPLAPGPDTSATVIAVSTSVAKTRAAQASPNATVLAPTPGGDTPTPLITNPTVPPATIINASATPSGPRVRPNGPTIHAARALTTIVIDGNLGEWAALPNIIDTAVYQPVHWAGPADQSAVFALAWDDGNLYLAAHITDDVHVQTQLGELIFEGDSLEVLLDADLAGDFDTTTLSGDDFQLGLTPGENKIGGPDAYLWFPHSAAGRPANVTVAAYQDETGTGYYLEAAIPWALFNASPAAKQTYGFALSASDNDTPDTAEQQSMISTSPVRRLANPTTWGTLMLDQ